jgi:hypothetical protein
MAIMPITLQNHTLVANSELDDKFPPVPPIPTLNSKPPMESDRIVLGTSTDRISIWANSDHSSLESWAFDTPGTSPQFRSRSYSSWTAGLLSYWDGNPAADYTLTHRQFWRQVNGSYTRLPPGNSQEVTYTKTVGISETDSETISAEMGVDTGSLSAKLSATFSHSVTTSAEQSETKKESVAAPDKGMIRVWMAWQLCDEIVALDRNGNLIPTGDQGAANRKAEIKWNTAGNDSGAWVWYKNARTVFPSDTVIYAQADFAAV